MIPKLNALQESQTQTSTTVLDCFNQIASLESKVVNLEEELVEDQVHVQCKLGALDRNMQIGRASCRERV